LKNIPFFDELEFEGPASVRLSLKGTLEHVEFDHRVDLTRIAYRYKDLFYKPGNAPNTVRFTGYGSSAKGIVLEDIEFV
ncbi:MAG: hypothetical protein GWM98_03695, partial [Nitrospinaceae bacterium]|nr:hypothetical protein [Nitrospinaceae bacterium]NIR53772.1 hypothetical protein [Nitrospinaceae bacterium]NIS84182.1 hypothetical protein [Nitrospinaceae bacterium]NIT80988.1 hypothetical protein [Nitrospinaceae bacterium]NIU43278.1 hypothetical protein [Nitrospinaceae bacterium]